ncbi:hypothetical protein [Streptomyces guryensis]|uniref:Uncharacterized protein n=1 Tax=Streptomyces guryensis TaxID=2886947 RepID=A0A9Q3Z7K3_9ACTN|nr:hypothetical protein [Streptomyces guryensis]MCD9878276.1 hypothetical protein [Streptomyces guryensis]
MAAVASPHTASAGSVGSFGLTGPHPAQPAGAGPDEREMAVVDLFRVRGGRIVLIFPAG